MIHSDRPPADGHLESTVIQAKIDPSLINSCPLRAGGRGGWLVGWFLLVHKDPSSSSGSGGLFDWLGSRLSAVSLTTGQFYQAVDMKQRIAGQFLPSQTQHSRLTFTNLSVKM
jgi:hypothetical protein